MSLTSRSRPSSGSWWACCLALLALLVAACDTGVVESPEPGILRVTMQADPNDNTIEVLGDELRIEGDSLYFQGQQLYVTRGASFPVTVTQGRIYRDSLYSVLYTTTDGYQAEDVTYEMLRRSDGQPVTYMLYETLVPPGVYDSLVVGFIPDSVRFGTTRQPVRLLEARNPAVTFREFPRDGQMQNTFEVFENEVTEVHLQMKPFRAIEQYRYRDEYRFGPEIEVTGLNYQR